MTTEALDIKAIRKRAPFSWLQGDVFALCDEVERLRALLQTCHDAITTLPEDAFGFAERDDLRWPIRDELLHNLAKLKETG